MKKHLILIIIYCLVYLFPPFGGIKGGCQTFQKTWGGVLLDQANDIIPTNDNNFVITGNTFNSKLGCDNILLMKIDTLGDTLWTRVYGVSGGQRGQTVLQTYNGGYLIGAIGGGFLPGSTTDDILLIKTDATGNLQWTKAYGGDSIDHPYKILEVPGGYLLAGNTFSFDYIDNTNGSWHIYLIKANYTGDTLWTKVIYSESGESDQVNSIIQLKDGNFLLSGMAWSFTNLTAALLIKIDTTGNILWSKAYKPKLTEARGVIEKENGNLIVMGNGYWGGGGNPPILYTQGIFIMETDSAGNMKWVKITDNGNDTTVADEYGYTIKNISKNDFLVSLHTDNYGDSVGTGSLWGGGGLIKFDSLFNIEWQKTYGGGGDWIYNNTIIGEQFINVGKMQSFDKGNNDIYIVSADSIGNAGCLSWDMNLTMLDIDPATIQVIDTGFVVGNTNTIVMDYPLEQGYPQLEMMDCSDWVGIATLSPPEGGRWVSIYPNPNGGRFEITITPTKYEQILRKYEVRIMNIFGQCVFQSAIYNPQSAMLKVDMSGEAAGIYFVEVRADNGEIERARVAVVK